MRKTYLPITFKGEDLLSMVDEILNHRRRGQGYQWLKSLKRTPRQDAKWPPARDFVDADET